MPEVNEFMHSKSMATPGLAGGIVMVITNSLVLQFGLPAAWIALALSFVAGTLALADQKSTLWEKVALYILNSLIIFSVAAGVNAAGEGTVGESGSAFTGAEASPVAGFFSAWF